MDNELDISYFASTLATLTGIPVRLYKGLEKTAAFSPIVLPKDPLEIYKSEVLSHNENVSYFMASDFSYYGILNHKDTKLVIGPTRLIPFDETTIKNLAFALNLEKSEMNDFENGMRAIITMPLESLMLTLLSFNYALNGEKLSLKDIVIHEPDQEILKKSISTTYMEDSEYSLPKEENDIHNTFDIESSMLHMISSGGVIALQEFAKNPPAVRPGVVAPDSLRQDKNIFIVSVTLASRAAIKGGLSVNEALSLSDLYIRRVELARDSATITNLQFRMVSDYCERVSKIRGTEPLSKLGLQVSEYVYSHIHEPIRLDSLAKALYMSKSNLCLRFKKEMGQTVEKFISSRKLIEAKNLLSNTDKPLGAIALYLGYSSQSHFTKAFLSSEGQSPSSYRKGTKKA